MIVVRAIIIFGMLCLGNSIASAQDAAYFDRLVERKYCPPKSSKYNEATFVEVIEKSCGKDWSKASYEMNECRRKVWELNASIKRYNKHIEDCNGPEKTSTPLPVKKTPSGSGSVSTFGDVPPSKPHVAFEPPSFNCGMAVSAAEKMICESANLAEADRNMSSMYDQLKERTQDAAQWKEFRQGQKDFIAKRDRCFTESCVLEAYKTRTSEVGDLISMVGKEKNIKQYQSEQEVDEAKELNDRRRAAEKEKARLEDKASTPSCHMYSYWKKTVSDYGLDTAEAVHNCSVLLRDLQDRGQSPCVCD